MNCGPPQRPTAPLQKTMCSEGVKGVKVKNIDFSRCSKVLGVGTLNLCLEMPDTLEKELAQSDVSILCLYLLSQSAVSI